MHNKKILPGILMVLCILIPSCTSKHTGTPPPGTPTTTNSGESSQTVEPSPTVEPTQKVEPADIIFHNGNIITVEKDAPVVQAIAIRGNLIQAIGGEAEIMALAEPSTQIINLQGNTMMPGIIDEHTHYLRHGWEDGKTWAEMMHNFLRFGYTSETEKSSTDGFINAILEAEKNSEVPIRVSILGQYDCPVLDDYGKSYECLSWYKDHDPILDPTRMVRVIGVKIFMDGAGDEARGCAAYSFDLQPDSASVWPGVWTACRTKHGDLYLTQEQLEPVLQDIQDRGYRAEFHAMGDASVETILNALDTVLAGKSNLTYRHQIVHLSTISPQQVERIFNMSVLVQYGGAFNSSELPWFEAVYGKDYYLWAGGKFALTGMGAHVSFGNDYNARTDINNLNPFTCLWGYVTMKDPTTPNVEPPDWLAKDKVSVQRAIEAMTLEGAFAESMEDYTGSLLPGKYADMIIISGNPLTMNPDDLLNLSVYMTMVNGEVKYCAEGREALCEGKIPAPTAMPTPKATLTPQTAALPATQETGETPLTFQVRYDCNARSTASPTMSSQVFLLTNIRWSASTEEQVNDFLNNVQYKIFVNGRQVASSLDHDQVRRTSDGKMFTTLAFFDVGKLSPGVNEIHTVLTFRKQISDGSISYGPGTTYETVDGTCTVTVTE